MNYKLWNAFGVVFFCLKPCKEKFDKWLKGFLLYKYHGAAIPQFIIHNL